MLSTIRKSKRSKRIKAFVLSRLESSVAGLRLLCPAVLVLSQIILSMAEFRDVF